MGDADPHNGEVNFSAHDLSGGITHSPDWRAMLLFDTQRLFLLPTLVAPGRSVLAIREPAREPGHGV
jgi:hypothetical protein